MCVYRLALLTSGYPHVLVIRSLVGALEFIPTAGWIMAAVTIITIGEVTQPLDLDGSTPGYVANAHGLLDRAPRVLGHELELRSTTWRSLAR